MNNFHVTKFEICFSKIAVHWRHPLPACLPNNCTEPPDLLSGELESYLGGREAAEKLFEEYKPSQTIGVHSDNGQFFSIPEEKFCANGFMLRPDESVSFRCELGHFTEQQVKSKF